MSNINKNTPSNFLGCHFGRKKESAPHTAGKTCMDAHMGPYGYTMAPHELMFSQIEAKHFQESFWTASRPLGYHFRSQIDNKSLEVNGLGHHLWENYVFNCYP